MEQPDHQAPLKASEIEKLSFFCWNIEMVDKYLKDQIFPFEKGLSFPKEYWKTLCTTERHTLMMSSNIYLEEFKK